MTILARQCYSSKPHPWHVWEIRWQRYLCTGKEK
jgi:hypothetical protein